MNELAVSEIKLAPDPYGTRLPLTINLRIKLAITGILFPGFSVGAGLAGSTATVGDPWQTGTFETYVALFLMPHGLLWFLPFIVLSAFSMLVLVMHPPSIKWLPVRLGLYSGAIVSLQYFIAILFVGAFVSPMAAGIVGPCLALLIWGSSVIVKKIKRFTIFHLMIATAAVAILTALGVAVGPDAYEAALIPIVGIFFAAPTLNVLTYVRMAVLASRHESIGRESVAKISAASAGVLIWLAGFIFAWRQAIENVLIEYQNLPVNNPNCFVASAAAYGNPGLVKSEVVKGSDGDVKLNEQMQGLKFLELVLQSSLPKTHFATRKVYNWIGPKLASLGKASPLMANAFYLLLKPLELAAVIARRIAGISADRVRQIYRR